jgi:hypothetical protein
LRTFLLDVVALALVLLTLTLDLYLPRVGSMATIDLGVLIIYPICLLTPVCVAIVMAPTMRMRPDPRRMLLFAALLGNGIVWMIWNADVDIARRRQGRGSIRLLGVHTRDRLRRVGVADEGEPGPAWDRFCEASLRLIPLISIAAAVVTVAIVWATPNVRAWCSSRLSSAPCVVIAVPSFVRTCRCSNTIAWLRPSAICASARVSCVPATSSCDPRGDGAGREPGEERVPGEHESRDPHADERRHRHDRHLLDTTARPESA